MHNLDDIYRQLDCLQGLTVFVIIPISLWAVGRLGEIIRLLEKIIEPEVLKEEK